MQFPEPSITNAVSVSEKNPDSAPVSEPALSAVELIEDFSESVHEGESLPNTTEALPPANHPMGETLDAESYPEIDGSHHDQIIENSEPALELNPSVASGDLSPCDEQPINQTESLPVTAHRRREMPLSGDTIRIKELAHRLGIPSYAILRDLVEFEQFFKTTDSVSAELAVRVGLKHGVDFVITESAVKGQGETNDPSSPPPKSAKRKNMAFQIKNGLYVRAGDWIRDSELGLGRVLKLHTDPEEPDRHQLWFVGNTEEGTVVERHSLYSSTLGIIDNSMIPHDIRSAAPEMCDSPH